MVSAAFVVVVVDDSMVREVTWMATCDGPVEAFSADDGSDSDRLDALSLF
jgi:hypothetical protein